MSLLDFEELDDLAAAAEMIGMFEQEDEEAPEPEPAPVTREMIIPGMMLRLAPDTSWMKDAACRGLGPDLFFPEHGEGSTAVQAKIVCRGCPVKEQCLNYAIDYHVEHGVWGGETEKGFLRVRKARNAENAAKAA